MTKMGSGASIARNIEKLSQKEAFPKFHVVCTENLSANSFLT
jgi:hypothetical protein